jgi:hypothetical protein
METKMKMKLNQIFGRFFGTVMVLAASLAVTTAANAQDVPFKQPREFSPAANAVIEKHVNAWTHGGREIPDFVTQDDLPSSKRKAAYQALARELEDLGIFVDRYGDDYMFNLGFGVDEHDGTVRSFSVGYTSGAKAVAYNLVLDERLTTDAKRRLVVIGGSLTGHTVGIDPTVMVPLNPAGNGQDPRASGGVIRGGGGGIYFPTGETPAGREAVGAGRAL